MKNVGKPQTLTPVLRMGRTSDQYSNNLAAALTVAAKGGGLNRIDRVALGEDGSRAFAVQDGLVMKVARVQTAEAVNTSTTQSAQTLEALPRNPDPASLPNPSPQQPSPAMSI